MLAMYLALLEGEAERERFTRLYEGYERKLYAVALRVLGNPTQAEDAAQQAWMLLAGHWDRVKPLTWEEAGAYAVTVAKNAAVDLLRRERRTAPLPEDWDMVAPKNTESEYQSLVELILALPEGYRRVLELKFVEERTNREIARRLGLKESTVATRVMRGRSLLLEAMEREGYAYA